MEITKDTPIEQIAALVCEALKKFDIDSVLVGGAVVSIYTLNEYQSYDLDFVIPGLAKDVSQAMKSLGFKKEKTRHWVHPKSPFFVEFPGSILSIGESLDVDCREFKTLAGKVKLLSPTSCTMDRLAGYYHWNDPQSLDQAVMIAIKYPVDLKKIKKWSQKEGAINMFKDFESALEKAKQKK